MKPDDEKRAKNRERQRRFRERQVCGETVSPVGVSEDVIDWLVDLGWLRPQDSWDRECVGLAIQALLSRAAERHMEKAHVTRYAANQRNMLQTNHERTERQSNGSNHAE